VTPRCGEMSGVAVGAVYGGRPVDECRGGRVDAALVDIFDDADHFIPRTTVGELAECACRWPIALAEPQDSRAKLSETMASRRQCVDLGPGQVAPGQEACTDGLEVIWGDVVEEA
jgi:hypothetical protein